MLQPTTLKFLQALKKNNSKEWFDVNRKQYESAKADFAALVDAIIHSFGKKDPSIAGLLAKECVFRINRDVRFSKNKDPYKTNMGASITAGGKKVMMAGYYFHFEPGGKSFVGGGLYMAEPDKLKKVRQEIDYGWNEFSKIIQHKKFKENYTDLDRSEGMSLVREPKGYEKDNPAIDYIKLKSWIALKPISDKELIEKDLVKTITTSFEALYPLIVFLNTALSE
ncbi:MAG: DUF2461 domain-containing protein [Bacteroidota bacterium]|jgi:uncharacterized protein (TIGR02453 family)